MIVKVGEIGINHNGNLDVAKDLINVAKTNGLDYVKFQKRDINIVYTKEELNIYRESPWGTTNREQKEGLELSYKDYCEIDRYCKQVGIKWFASPWDINSVDFLMQFDLDYIKVPSALVTYDELLYKIKNTKIPVIISTGMSTAEEIDKCVKLLGSSLEYILHCTSTYPCKTEELNMRHIKTLNELYQQYKIGFSNHASGIVGILAAVVLDAKMVEFHITLDRSMYGSDQSASIEPQGIYKICDYINFIEESLGDGVKKVFESELSSLQKLRKY